MFAGEASYARLARVRENVRRLDASNVIPFVGDARFPAVAGLDAVLVDVQLPDIDGLTLASRLRQTDGSLRIVLTSTDPTLVSPAALARGGAFAFVPKDKLAITDLALLLGD